MKADWSLDDNVVDVWFRLRDAMQWNQGAVALRPPSLRDAVYAYALASRTATESDPEIVESFVNGIELGAMAALRDAWEKRNG